MADWATISALATAAGTLALAAATYASVRSANRSARLAEVALQEQRRPVLVSSRAADAIQSIGFADDHWYTVSGGGAVADAAPEGVYLVVSLRNVGAGLAVMQGWHACQGDRYTEQAVPEVNEFRALTRDQYIPPADIGVWQGAIRDPADPLRAALAGWITERRAFTLDLLYTDQIGGQRTITRFGVLPGEDGWIAPVGLHWYLDSAAPR